MGMRYTGRRLIPPAPVARAAMSRTSPQPAKPQAVHNLFFNVDVTRYPNIQRLLDERVGPQWNGIRQLMTMPLADASGYSMVYESVTLLCVFVGGISAVFFDPSWADDAASAPKLPRLNEKQLQQDGPRFKLTVFKLGPWPPQTSPQERWLDSQNLYRLLRCSHAHSFALLETGHPQRTWVTADKSPDCPAVVLRKPRCSPSRLAQLEALRSPALRPFRTVLNDKRTLQLPAARLYVFVHRMVMNLLTCDQTLQRIERELGDGRWRS